MPKYFKSFARLSGLAALLLAILFGLPAAAQTSAGADPAAIQKLIDDAQNAGARVVVIEAPSGAVSALTGNSETPSLASRLETGAIEFRDRLRVVLSGASTLIGDTEKTLRRSGLTFGEGRLLIAVFFGLVFLAVGYAVERLFRAWARPKFAYLFNPTPQSQVEKIGYLLLSGLMKEFSIVLQGATALLLMIAIASDNEHVRATQVVLIAGVITIRGLLAYFAAFLAVDAGSHRLIHATDEAAKRIYRGLVLAMSVVGAAFALCLWMEQLNLNADAHKLGVIGATLISALLFGSFAIRRRKDVAAILLGPDPDSHQSWWRGFAKIWHGLAVIYIATAFVVTSVRLVLDIPDVFALVAGPMFVLLCALTLYGVALLFIEWAFNRSAPPLENGNPEALTSGTDTPDEVSAEDEDEDESYSLERHRRSYKEVAEHAAAIPIVAFAVWAMFRLWGMDLLASESIASALLEVFIILFLAYLAFEAVDIAIDRKIEEEGGYTTAAPGEEGGTGGTSRLTTLLPLFRNFVLITIITIAGMIALSQLGVDIAPLFAGAGVLGLAIGFGAQSLIRDIFSGAFFLIDDAFRIGEYIDIGDIKGSVEKISIRSMQLRHHRGALHTIPFGEIKHLTNYSRDWVMMKLPLRVVYDTDVEKVRKLVKNLGKDLMKHPEVGHLFLQPLKSQGVFSMEDSAMIIRVKYMTKPGDQFMTRKVVYAEIQKLFDEHGIKFAHRRVTVDVAVEDKKDAADDRTEIVGAAAGAALPTTNAP
jgi:small-conductance mechanosensitive channel